MTNSLPKRNSSCIISQWCTQEKFIIVHVSAARLLTLFALIPMPTIRSLVSQQVPASSCGEYEACSSTRGAVKMQDI